MSTPGREKILQKIRTALAQPTPLPFPESESIDSPFQPPQADNATTFAEHFTQLGGQFALCANEQELKAKLQNLLQEKGWTKIFCTEEWKNGLPSEAFTNDVASCDAAITGCEALVARTGSVVLSAHNGGRVPSVYAPVHICVAHASQLVYDVKDALVMLQQQYNGALPSLITFATGPSRTADIEKTLVVGVHGPKGVYCFLIQH